MSKTYPKTPVPAIVNNKPSALRAILLKRKNNQIPHSLVVSNTCALKIADYVHMLKHGCKLSILTIKESNEDGWYVRSLQSNVPPQEPENEL